MSDTTNERPDKPGLWFRYGEPYSVTHVEPDVCCYAIQSNGIPTYLRCAAMEGGWSKAVPSSELATLTARLAKVEAERNCLLVTGGSTNPFEVAEAIQRLKERAEAAETRVKVLTDRLELEGISMDS